MSRSLAVLSGNEENSALSGAMAQLSEVQKNMEQIHNDQVRHYQIHYLEAMYFLGWKLNLNLNKK